MQRKRYIIALLMLLVGAVGSYAADGDFEPFVLAIDAGHGGHDQGTRGRRAREKDVTLKVARLLAQKVKDRYGDSVQVVLTRDADVFVGLRERADIANRAGADLFISIHVNSVAARSRGRDKVKGTSVYTLGLHKSEANLAVAMAENAVIELEENYSETYQGFDPNLSESYIIFELSQENNLNNSLDMAALAQEQLIEHAGRADRGVRQAGFLVLWATRMPSVLVELDFMCNPTMETFLASADGQERCAEALARAFHQYRTIHPHERRTAAPDRVFP